MFKTGILALFAAAALSPCLAQADEFDQGMVGVSRGASVAPAIKGAAMKSGK